MRRRLLIALAVLLAAYGLIAYVLLPALWRHYEHAPELESAPKFTETSAGFRGDALNVALYGTREELIAAFAAAGWKQPASIDLRSSAGIAESVILDRPDANAPVSNLFLMGRKQDLAFEQEVGKSARERNHVRFWQTQPALDASPLWLGAATFDRGVGIDRRTGEFTHHIGPDIDAERDRVFADLARAGQLTRRFQVTGVGATLDGRNGNGDRYYTDGEMDVGVLIQGAATAPVPEALPNPPAVRAKNRLFAWLRPWLDRGAEASSPTQ